MVCTENVLKRFQLTEVLENYHHEYYEQELSKQIFPKLLHRFFNILICSYNVRGHSSNLWLSFSLLTCKVQT